MEKMYTRVKQKNKIIEICRNIGYNINMIHWEVRKDAYIWL